MSSPIAFIVEGHQEQEIIKRLCPKSPVQLHGCNGRHVTLELAAERIASLTRILSHKARFLIVNFDRECRDAPAAEVAAKLKAFIIANNEKFNAKIEFDVCVPDRMVENWILAGIEKTNAYEGRAPNSAIKEKYSNYSKTTLGVDLFCKCKSADICANSPSFKAFADAIGSKMKCWWMEK